jgi:mercuric ion binding protein
MRPRRSVRALLPLLAWALAAPAWAQVTSVIVTVEGMSCPFCAYGVEKKLKKVPGAASVDIDMQGGTATVHAREGASLDVAEVPGAIRDSGFTPGEVRLRAVGRVTERGGRLLLEAPDLHRPVVLDGGEAATRERLSALAGSGATAEVRGPVRRPRAEEWHVTPEQVSEVAK